MMSERRQAASRANGKLTKGPRTAEGKAESRKNARRHGLNSPIRDDPALFARAAKVAELLKDEFGLDELTWAYAQAYVQVQRVLEVKAATLAKTTMRVASEPGFAKRTAAEKVARAFQNALPELRRLGSYERKARSALSTAARRIREAHTI